MDEEGIAEMFMDDNVLADVASMLLYTPDTHLKLKIIMYCGHLQLPEPLPALSVHVW